MTTDHDVALELGKRLLERSTLTTADVQVMVTDARRAVAKRQLCYRLRLLVPGDSWPDISRRETIRRCLSEMDALEIGQDVPAQKPTDTERKNPENERETAQRKASPQAGQPRAENGPHGGKPAVPAHGHPAPSTGTGKPAGPATVGKGGA